jgi:hypothetical protein
MPTLASLILAAFLVLAFVTSSSAHGGDPAVLHVCIGPLGVMRAVAPQESCPRNHTAVHLGIGTPPAVSFYTVERPTELVGPGTITVMTVSCEDGDQVVGGGYAHTTDQPDLQVSASTPGDFNSENPPGDYWWSFRVQNFSFERSYELALFARCARLTP